MAVLTEGQHNEIIQLITERTAALNALSKDQRDEVEKIIEKSVQSIGLSSAQKWDAATVFAKIGTGIVAALGVAGYFLINSAAQVAATAAAQKITATEAADRLARDPDFTKRVQAGISSVPQNSVVAFTNYEACPAGWKPFENAYGRTLFGAAPVRQESSMPIFPSADLKPGSVGGTRAVNIQYPLTKAAENVGNAMALMPGSPVIFANSKGINSEYYIIPPYVTVLFCLKA